MAGLCTGDGPCDATPIGTGKNWVTSVGGLPLYIRAIAQALLRNGHTEAGAIQLAVGAVQRWARGQGKVSAATRARAAAALAEWEAKKAAAHLSNEGDPMTIDLAFDPSETRGFGGKWSTSGSGAAPAKSSPAATKTQAQALGVDPAVLAQVAKQLGISTAQVTSLVQQGRAAKAKKSGGSGGGGASKGKAASSAAKKAATAQAAAVKKAASAKTSADKKAAAAQLKAANQAVAAAKRGATAQVASSMPVTKASIAKAGAINGLNDAQRTLISGSTPPSGFTWSGNSLVKAVNLSTPMNLRTGAREAAKQEGATLPGTLSYPTQTRALFDKAVQAVGRGGPDHDRIRKYLIGRAQAKGWTDAIPDTWADDGSLKGAA